MDLLSYLQLPKQLRQSHLNLDSPCDYSGGKGGGRKILMRRKLFDALGLPFESNIQSFGACLCHRCPNGNRNTNEHYCVNPLHLYIGTPRENRCDFHEDNPEWDNTSHTKLSQPLAVEAALSPEARAKRKETYKLTKHAQGEKNSQYGTMWVTNGISNLKVKKTDPIPEGYKRGRTL